ncbi:MAG: hypothetical protein EOM59_19005 [Clostridia bacterium]|nr:hypothetical protein [Clostridia bacterium]
MELFLGLVVVVLLVVRSIWKKQKQSSSQKERTKPRIAPKLDKLDTYKIASIDFETTGISSMDEVLAAGCIKYDVDWENGKAAFSEFDRCERYYFPRGKYKIEATRVNGITKKKTIAKRDGHKWPKFFNADKSFWLGFVDDCDLVIGYNILFEDMFFPELADKGMPLFCVMGPRRMSLSSLAERYDIPVNEELLHSALYDAELTKNVYEFQLRFDNDARKSMGRSPIKKD